MGRGKGTHTQPEWMARVKVGSVLRNRRGTDFRVVRRVSRFANGDLSCVSMVIRRCSWTERPYTVYNYVDLLYAGYELVDHVRVKLDKPIDYVLERNIVDSDRREMDCSMVRGIP